MLGYVDAATVAVEKDLEKALAPQTFELRAFEFPPYGEGFYLHRDPISTVESITYLDSEGDRQTLDPAAYFLDESQHGVFNADQGNGWPTGTVQAAAVVVTFTAGYGVTPENTPFEVKQAIYTLLHSYFYGDDVADNYQMHVNRMKRATYP